MNLEELGLDTGRYHAFEFWTARYLGETGDSLSLGRLPPHGSAVVRLTPTVDEPRLIGSNIHVSQGAAELKAFVPGPRGLSLSLESPTKIAAVLMLSIPEAGTVGAEAGGGIGQVVITRPTSTACRLEFELDCHGHIELTWPGQGHA